MIPRIHVLFPRCIFLRICYHFMNPDMSESSWSGVNISDILHCALRGHHFSIQVYLISSALSAIVLCNL